MPPRRPRSDLESRIETLATTFARQVMTALRSVPLAEIALLAGANRVVAAVVAPSAVAEARVATPRRRRKISNYPKCAWAGCGKNRSPRTIPYCGEHYRAVKAGQTPPAGSLGTGIPHAASGRPGAVKGVRVTKGAGRKRATG
jgi:hypothetical protein